MSTLPEPTVSVFDLEDQKERHRVTEREFLAKQAEATERARTRRVRIENTSYAFITLFIVAGIIALVYVIWQANKGPSASDTINQEQYTTCVSKGGTYTQLGADTDKTCVFMKEVQP